MKSKYAQFLYRGNLIHAVWDNSNDRWLFSIEDVLQALFKNRYSERYRKSAQKRLSQKGLISKKNGHRETSFATLSQTLEFISHFPPENTNDFRRFLTLVSKEDVQALSETEYGTLLQQEKYSKYYFYQEWIPGEQLTVKTVTLREERYIRQIEVK